MREDEILTEGRIWLRRSGERLIGIHRHVEWVAETEDGPFARLHSAVLVPSARRAGIGVQEWRPRLAVEGRSALGLLLGHLFRQKHAHSVMLDARDTEGSLLTAALQCGFREEGRRRHAALVEDFWHDHVDMSILEDEWRRGDNPEDVASVPHRPEPVAADLPAIPEPLAWDFAMLRGPRVTMRRKRPEDKERFFRWQCRSEWWRGWMPEDPAGFRAPTREEFEAQWRDAPTPNEWIVETERGVPIGRCFYSGLDRVSRAAEGGFLLYDAGHWGRGYGTEAFGLLLRHAFEDLHLHRVHSATWAGNVASLSVQLKNGLRIESRGRDSYFVDGRWYDTCRTAALDNEWRRSVRLSERNAT